MRKNWLYLKQIFRFVSCSLLKFKNDIVVISERIKTLKHCSVKAESNLYDIEICMTGFYIF